MLAAHVQPRAVSDLGLQPPKFMPALCLFWLAETDVGPKECLLMLLAIADTDELLICIQHQEDKQDAFK